MKEAPGYAIDGGSKAWISTFGAWWAIFITFGWINSLGVFQSYYEQNILSNETPSNIAWIASVQQSLIYSGGILFGKIFDGYGPRALLIFGGVAQVFGLMMTSISTKYYQIFLAQAVCSALGASAVVYGTLGALATWWKVKRATAYGLATSGSSMGGVIFPVMVNRLLPRIGFGWTMRTVAFIVLIGVILSSATIVSNRAHTPSGFSLRMYLATFKDSRFVLLCISMTIFGFGLFIPFNFIPSAAQSLGMSAELSVYAIAILNATSIFGRILPGFFADKFGRFNMMTICTFVSAILTLALWLPGNNNAATLCFAAFFGFFSGTYVSLTPALVVEVSPPQDIGLRTGVLYFCISVGVLTGSPIAGALLNTDNGQYTYVKIFSGVTMLAGAVGVAFLTLYIRRLAAKTNAQEEDQKDAETELSVEQGKREDTDV